MKKLFHLLFLIALFNSSIHAQDWTSFGVRSNSLGNASVTLSDSWSYFNNPATTSLIQKKQVAFNYENKYLLKEFQKQSISLTIPLKKGVFSFGSYFQGNQNLRSYRSGLGYSLKLIDKLQIGTQLNIQGIQLPSYYGNKTTVTAEIGILSNLTSKWTFGCAIFNLTNSKISLTGYERIPSRIRIGTSYTFSKEIMTLIEFEKTNLTPIRFKTGIEYSLRSIFFTRLGISTTPLEINFGFGIKWKQFLFDLGSNYHSILGYSPSISMNYQLSK